jgi:hypothetical protein
MMDKHVPCQRSLQYKYRAPTLPLKVSVKTAQETDKMAIPSQDTQVGTLLQAVAVP